MYKFPMHSINLRYLKHQIKLSTKAFNTPRPPKDPPDEGYRPESVDHKDLEVPDFVRPEAYRKFSACDEVLGPGAGKSKEYKNGHYFGYHRFSFVELQNQSVELRDESRLGGGVQANMGEDEEEESPDDSMECFKERNAECEEMLAAQQKEGEKEKLKDWCLAMEKKQQEKQKDQGSKKDDEQLKSWCKDLEKQKQNVNRLEKEKEKIQKTIDKRVNEILVECTNKLEKVSEGPKDKELVIKKALAECEHLVKTAADKAKENDGKTAVKCDEKGDKKKEQEKCEKKDEKAKDKCEKTDKDKKK